MNRTHNRKTSTSTNNSDSKNQNYNRQNCPQFKTWSEFHEKCFIEKKTVRLSGVNVRRDTFVNYRGEPCADKDDCLQLELKTKIDIINGFEIPMDLADREISFEDEDDYFFELAPFSFNHAKKMLTFSEMTTWHDWKLPDHNRLNVQDIGKKMFVSIYRMHFIYLIFGTISSFQ